MSMKRIHTAPRFALVEALPSSSCDVSDGASKIKMGSHKHFGEVWVSANAGADWILLEGYFKFAATWTFKTIPIPAGYLPFPLKFAFRQNMGNLVSQPGNQVPFSGDQWF
jgi:hypothetical protein